MRKNKFAAALLTVVLASTALLSGCGGNNTGGAGGAEGKTYKFRLADNHAPDYPTVIGDKKFAELVAAKSNGRITIDVFPSGQLGDEKSVIEQVQLGALEFTRVNTAPLAEFNKNFGVFSLPYIFDNDDHLWSFLNGDGQKMLEGMAQSKLMGLAYYDSGSRFFYSRTPVTSLNDLKGHKIRVQQNAINMDLITSLGASPTPMAFGEVYSSLQTGVIDGAENNWPSIYSTKHYEVAKHIIVDSHQRQPEVLLMSKNAWDKLSAEDQQIIKESAMESVQTQREAWRIMENDAQQAIRAAGVTVTEVSDLTPWQAATKSVVEKHGASFAEILDQINKARTAAGGASGETPGQATGDAPGEAANGANGTTTGGGNTGS